MASYGDETAGGALAAAGSYTIVIGLGNTLMGDDGIGIHALERLEALNFEPPVSFVYGDTWGLALLPEIEDADSVLLLDAIRANSTPGTVHVLRGDQIDQVFSTKISPHQIDVRELLALASLRNHLPIRLAAVGVEPAQVDLATELTPTASQALATMVDTAVNLLSTWGHRVT